MCQTATPTLGSIWTTCTMTTQNFKTLQFPQTPVLHLRITRLLVACPAASRVCVQQGSAVSSALPGRQPLRVISANHISKERDRNGICTQGPSGQPAQSLPHHPLHLISLRSHPDFTLISLNLIQGPTRQPAHSLPHYPLCLPGRQNHVWTHRRTWRNRLCTTRAHLVCSYR